MRRPAKFGRNRSSHAGDIKDFSYLEWPYILMHRAYPLALENNPSLTLSCGLGFGFR